jgi:glycine/D-amino acid oxidase-like deaminating enzyme
VAVVGAGVVGLAIAFHLAERGASVVVYERTGIGAGASGLQPGGVRRQWGTRVNCLLAGESLRWYAGARERLRMRADPGFRACGYLFLAHSEDALARLRRSVELQNELGVPSRIVTPAGAAELVPDLRPEVLAGAAWCAEDGYFDRPQALVEALGALADVRIREVRSLDHLQADAVVVAAGADTPRLLPELPIRPEARVLCLSDPIRERLLEPLVVSAERGCAAKQLADGRLLASGDRAALHELLPRLVHVALPHRVEGVYDTTPDHQAILGRVHERVWVAAGSSGHGFMQAPAVGRILAEAILDGREDEALRVLDPQRFAEGRLVPEPQIV